MLAAARALRLLVAIAILQLASAMPAQEQQSTDNVFPSYMFRGGEPGVTGPLIYDAAAVRARDLQDHESDEWTETADTTWIVKMAIVGDGDEEDGLPVQGEGLQADYVQLAEAMLWRISDLLDAPGDVLDQLLRSENLEHPNVGYFGGSWLPTMLSTSYAQGALLDHAQLTFGANMIEDIALGAYRLAAFDRRLVANPFAPALRKLGTSDKAADLHSLREILSTNVNPAAPVVTRAAKYADVLAAFAFGHEMGHFILGHVPYDEACSPARRAKEADADKFAVATIVAMMSPTQIRAAIGAPPHAEFPVRAALDGFSTLVLPYLGPSDGCSYMPRAERRAAINSTFDRLVRLRATAFEKLQRAWTRSPAGLGWLIDHPVELADLRGLNAAAAKRCGGRPPATRPQDFGVHKLAGTMTTLVFARCAAKAPNLSSLTATDRALIGAEQMALFRHYYERPLALEDRASLENAFLIGLRSTRQSFFGCDFHRCGIVDPTSL